MTWGRGCMNVSLAGRIYLRIFTGRRTDLTDTPIPRLAYGPVHDELCVAAFGYYC